MDQTDPATGQDTPDLSPTEMPPAPPPRRGSGRWLLTGVLLAALAAGAYWGWLQWQALQADQQRGADWLGLVDQLQQQNAALRDELQQLRERQRALDQRISESGNSNRVLREELLGVGERAAALEDALSRLARARREGAQALKLEEIDFVLQLAAERLQLFGDVERATRAMQLAAESLDTIGDPAFAGVRQTLAQELALLRNAPADPRAQLHAALQTLQRQVAELPFADDRDQQAADAPPWQQLLGALVRIRRLDDAGEMMTPVERATRRSALQLQLALAQSALERRDPNVWQSSLTQARQLFDSLFDADAAATRAAQASLQTLIASDPGRALPTLGAALRELRNLRATRRTADSDQDATGMPLLQPPAAAAPVDAPASPEPADEPTIEREQP